MKAEDARKMTDDALARLATALEQGRSESLTQYLAVMARFHRYSFGNILLILSQRPEATRVAGFNAWLNLKRFVRKGERGIAIFAPMRLRVRDDDRREPSPSNDEAARAVLRFRVVHVFDIAQTDGEPLPEPARVQGDASVYTLRLQAYVAACGITLDRADVPFGADGVSTGGRIAVRPDLSPAEEFAVIVHELAHELQHRGEDRRDFSKTVRETEAEAVAFVVSAAIGLDTGTAASDYIQLYNGDKDTLSHSLDRIQKTASSILAAIGEDADVDAPPAE
ncbi:MAG: ArdC family protein [Phycisphaerales bacterium]